MEKPDPQKNPDHISLGYTLAAGMGVLCFIGYWIDQKRHTEPFWTITFLMIAFVYCGYEIWKYIRDTNDKK